MHIRESFAEAEACHHGGRIRAEAAKRSLAQEDLLDYSANINPLGHPPLEDLILREMKKIGHYPDNDYVAYRRSCARFVGVDPENVVPGNGSSELMRLFAEALIEEGDRVLIPTPTFGEYEAQSRLFGAEVVHVPQGIREPKSPKDFLDDALLGGARVIFICNPNNPTGTYWNEARLRRFLERVDGEQIVVVDEAYAEFVEQPDFPESMRLIQEFPNLVVFRTFSKIYGLAALRIGYLAGDRSVVDVIRRTCVVYSVNTLAQEAALAALGDDGTHIARTRSLIRASKEYLLPELDRMDLPYISGEGNFVMIRLPFSDTLAYRRLMRKGYMIRTMTGFRFPNHIRVTLHDVPVMEGFVDALRNTLA